jgi:hypothetical protein
VTVRRALPLPVGRLVRRGALLLPATRGLIAVLAITLMLRIFYGMGYVAYDGMYSLVWGSDIAHGRLPDYEVAIAPTPHPLFTFMGVLLSPFGDSAADVFQAVVMISFAALGWVAFELGRRLFSVPVGLLFAAIILSRKLLVMEALQASLDIPFVTLVLAALLLEVQKPRRGMPVLALLAAAGLLRPEAWLLSLAYLIYVAAGASGRERLRLGVVALSAPLLWALSDLIVTGSPLFSFHGTQDLAAQLHRPRGFDTAVRELPIYTRLILFNPIMSLGIVGGILALYSFRDRSRLPALLALLGVVSFLILGVMDLPLLIRYLVVPAAILALFCGVASFGWLNLPHSPQRSVWLAACPFLLLPLLLSIPQDHKRVETAKRWAAAQRHAQDTLRSVATGPATAEWIQRCPSPVYVPNHRVVPLLAYWLDRPPADFASVPQAPTRGLVIVPANPVIAATLILDPHEPRPGPEPPPTFQPVARTSAWTLYARC